MDSGMSARRVDSDMLNIEEAARAVGELDDQAAIADIADAVIDDISAYELRLAPVRLVPARIAAEYIKPAPNLDLLAFVKRCHLALQIATGRDWTAQRRAVQFRNWALDRWAPVSLARRHRPYTAILDRE
jgi:hypothetical protein